MFQTLESKYPKFYQFFRLFVVVIASILFAWNLCCFAKTANLFPGGFSGLSLLLQEIIFNFLHIRIPYTIFNRAITYDKKDYYRIIREVKKFNYNSNQKEDLIIQSRESGRLEIGKIYKKETFEDIRERLNGETKMSKITDYLLKDDVIVVMDVDGVLAPYEFSELSHSMTDDEWDRLVASGENPYKDVRPIKLMQEFIQKKGVDKVYTCSKSPLSEIPGKKAFIKDNYNLPDDNIYFTLEKTEKLTVLQTLQQKLGLKPSQIAIVEDTVKTLDYIRAHSDFVTVHVSSFME